MVDAVTTRANLWRGNPGWIDKAAALFEQNPNIQTFLDYASALYPFSFMPSFKRRLLGLLQMHGEGFYYFLRNQLPMTGDEIIEIAKQSEMHATYLHWESRKTKDAAHAEALLRRATMLANGGAHLSEGFEKNPELAHIWCLVRLTLAWCLMDEAVREMGTRKARRDTVALHYLDSVAELAAIPGRIRDSKQLVRVLAKLGSLYRKAGNHCAGYHWGTRATTAKGVPAFVRAKALVSLAPKIAH